jgi:hypothetical protein
MLDDDPAIRRSRRSEGTKASHFGFEFTDTSVSRIVNRCKYANTRAHADKMGCRSRKATARMRKLAKNITQAFFATTPAYAAS